MNSQVILVDDSSEDAELAIRAFKKSDPKVDINWVQNGDLALELINQINCGALKSNAIKLFIFDIKMYEVSGFELLKAIRDGEVTKYMPVIILSSSKLDKDIKQAYSLGANSYIEKPAKFKDYLTKIDVVSNYWLNVNTM